MKASLLWGLPAIAVLGACAQPETAAAAEGTETTSAEATTGQTVQIKVTGMR